MKLIAIVTVLALVDGQRKEIQPGEPIPDMHPSDVKYLKDNGCIYDEDEKLAAEKAAAKDEKQAGKEFTEARKAVQAAQEAIAPAAK